MQDEQTVSFQPMDFAYPQPWFTKLFVLYSMFVFVLLLVRAFQIASSLRRLRKLQKQSGSSPIVSDSLLTDCYLKADSFKSFAMLTFLVSLLNFAWYVANVLLALMEEKTSNLQFTFIQIGQALIPLMLGLILCIALYAGGMLSKSALRRRQPVLAFIAKEGRSEPLA